MPALAVKAMLEARSVAVVGATPKAGSFGDRVLTELSRSTSAPAIHLVNPKYESIGGLACLPSLEAIAEPVDLVLLCVGDQSLESQLSLAAKRGDGAAVIYGSAVGDDLRQSLATIGRQAGMALCGGGCMGFVNVAKGLRAIGYIEPCPLPVGPIALVTHSGSAFSALLRADRRLGWTMAVSSGQELVTSTAAYVDYALTLETTKVVALLLETLREPLAFRNCLQRCAEAGVPVVALTVGGSPGGRAMVAAHSGALAGDDAMWEALCQAHGVLRVGGLDEMVDALELLAAGRRAPAGLSGTPGPGPGTAGSNGRGIATVHDSGAERTLVADVADSLGVPFATISHVTHDKLAAILDPGLEPGNPLDVWGTGARTRELFGECLTILAADEAVDAVALCVDLPPELDGDTAYFEALLDTWQATGKPVCVVSNLPSSIDRRTARLLRDAGIPVLEGTKSGLRALRLLLDHRQFASRAPVPASVDTARQARWLQRLQSLRPLESRPGQASPQRAVLSSAESLALIADYGLHVPANVEVASRDEAVEAAKAVGWPVALKTTNAAISHKTEAGGVVLGLATPEHLAAAYDEMAAKLGPAAVVMAMAPPGTELALGIVADPLVGPMVVVGAGGVLVEVLADRAVALAPLDVDGAGRLVGSLAVSQVLQGARGAEPADLGAVAASVAAVAQIALELGEAIAALDVNPLRCTPAGALALDALVEV
ncbi:MAG: acetate--CoA ligase family protein [Acidimicrobiales bacterium]